MIRIWIQDRANHPLDGEIHLDVSGSVQTLVVKRVDVEINLAERDAASGFVGGDVFGSPSGRVQR